MTTIKIATFAAAIVLGIAFVSPNQASAKLAANSTNLNAINLNALNFNGTNLNALNFNGSALHGREQIDAEHDATGFNVNAVTVREVILNAAPQRPEAK
jgi:uncharacterized protein YjbI with pentapeptide repeats